MKEVPILYRRKEECCGCTACYAICPQSAIDMVEDEEGFEYPQINESKCVRCYKCMKVCSYKDCCIMYYDKRTLEYMRSK